MLTQSDSHQQEVSRGDRFEFGKNWANFLAVLDEERITEAERSLREKLGVETLRGMTFLDVGCGSGLFSLAAARLGAKRVHSFDFDPSSVGCASELRRRFFPGSDTWSIEPGSALDPAYLEQLGMWDVVYSWGVLHHTGDMWQALGNVAPLVRSDGTLVVPLSNENFSIAMMAMTSDGGQTWSSNVQVSDGTLTDTQAIAITVANVNEAPTGTDYAIAINEDTPYTFSVVDFWFADLDNIKGDFLLAEISYLFTKPFNISALFADNNTGTGRINGDVGFFSRALNNNL